MLSDVLYSPEEIAQKLKISKYTVYEMIKRGELGAHQIGRHLRISDTQLDHYLARTKGSDNIFEAEILVENGEICARTGTACIRVNTELSGDVRLSIRPEDIILSKGTFVSSARNVHKGVVTDIIANNGSAKVFMDIGVTVAALITKKSLEEMAIKKGDTLYAIFKTMAVRVFK